MLLWKKVVCVFPRFEVAGNTWALTIYFFFLLLQTGERLQELRGHSQQITAITTFTCNDGLVSHVSLITASSDRSLSVSSSLTKHSERLHSDASHPDVCVAAVCDSNLIFLNRITSAVGPRHRQQGPDHLRPSVLCQGN